MHLFAGPRREDDVQAFLEVEAEELGLNLLMVSVDLLVDPDRDLADPDTFSTIMSLVEEGLVDVVLGGPPCSTWSRVRHRYIPGGPRPLRLRRAYARSG